MSNKIITIASTTDTTAPLEAALAKDASGDAIPASSQVFTDCVLNPGTTNEYTCTSTAPAPDGGTVTYPVGAHLIRIKGTTITALSKETATVAGAAGGTPVPTPSQLSAPTGLAATPTDATTIGTSWNPSINATAYQLQRALVTGGAVGMYVTIYTNSNTSYVDSGRTTGNTYAYRVLTVGDGVTYTNSPYSTIAQATVLGAAVVRAVRVDGHSVNTTYNSSGEGIAGHLQGILGTTSYTDFRSPAVPGQSAAQMLARLRNGGPDSYGGPAYVGSTLPDRTGQSFGIVTVLGALNTLDPIAGLRYSGDTAGADAMLAQLKADYQSYISEALAKNWFVILLEEAAAQGTTADYVNGRNVPYFAEQRAWNDYLLANYQALGAKALVRTMNDANFADAAATANAAIYADHTHLTDDGRACLASQGIAPAIMRVSAGETGVVIPMNPSQAIDITIQHSDVPPMFYVSGDRVQTETFTGTNSNILLRRVDIFSVFGKDIIYANYVDVSFLRDGAAPKVFVLEDGATKLGQYDCAGAAGSADGFATFPVMGPIQDSLTLENQYKPADGAGERHYIKSVRFRTN